MIEGLLIAAGPVLIKEIYSRILPFNVYANVGIFIASIYLYTLIVLTYRCKFKTKDKPNFSYTKALYSVIPFVVYYAARIILEYLPPTPITFLASNILSKTIVLFLVAYIAYYQQLRYVFDDCFEDTFLDKIIKFFKSIWNTITGIF